MSGFDNGTMQGGVYFQAKQFGSIYRGLGPPVPQAGVVGDLYVDTQTWQLFNKRSAHDGVDPWGHYLFTVPALYQAGLKWFSSSAPKNDFGANGDYCLLWGGFGNYGLQPSIYGPKAAGVWPANPVNVAVTLDPLYTATDINDLTENDIVIIGQSAVPVSLTGFTNEVLLASVPVVGMGVNGVLRITSQWSYSGGAGTWTPRTKFGGVPLLVNAFGATTFSARMQAQLANRGAVNSQVGNSLTQLNWANNANAALTAAVDTSVLQNVDFTGQLANAGDTIRLESFLVELMARGA